MAQTPLLPLWQSTIPCATKIVAFYDWMDGGWGDVLLAFLALFLTLPLVLFYEYGQILWRVEGRRT